MPGLRRTLRAIGIPLLLAPLPAAHAARAAFGSEAERPGVIEVLRVPGLEDPVRVRVAFVLAYAATMAGAFLLLGSFLAPPRTPRGPSP